MSTVLEVFALLFAVLTASVASAAITTPESAMPPPMVLPEPIRIGVFRTGMTLEEAQAAAPDATWVATPSPLTGRVLESTVANALVLAGLPFYVSLRPGYFGSYRIELTALAAIRKEKTCRAQYIGVLTELERLFGTFDAPSRARPLPPVMVSAPSVQYSRTPEGYGVVTGVPAIYASAMDSTAVGEASHFESHDNSMSDDGAEWTAEWVKPAHDDIRSIVASAYHTPWEPSTSCMTTVDIAYLRPAPAFQEIPFDELVVIARPSISTLHYSVVGMTIPEGGVDVSLQCEVARAYGTIENCRSPPTDELNPSPEKDAVRAAIIRLRSLRVDNASLDPDNPVPLRTKTFVHVTPDDRRDPDPTGQQPMPMTGVNWTAYPSSNAIQNSYPQDALRLGREAAVEAVCQIQTDLSLICTRVAVDPPDARAFAAVVDTLAPVFRAAPTLPTGKSAVGAWVAFKLQFKLAD